MASAAINTRKDLDAIAGTPEHSAFVAALRGSLWRLEKDDEAKGWRAVEDDSTVERFGFIRADFPGAQAPALPEYAPAPTPIIPPLVVSRYQGMTALYLMGTPEDNPLKSVNAYMLTADPLEQLAWETITEFREDSPLLAKLAALLGLTDTMVKDLFRFAATIQA